MSTLVGIVPCVPSWLSGLVAPIPAQRLAAWRIVVGIVLLFDVSLFYMPMVRGQLYGPDSLEGPGVFAERFAAPYWNWSLLNVLPVDSGASIAVGIWAATAGMLIVGYRPNLAALVAWALSLSFYNSNFYLHNSGDRLRHFVLLLLAFAKTDATWAIRRRPGNLAGPLSVSGWPARLMLMQMVLMHFMNGIYKLQGDMWRDGSVLWYVNHDVAWARWSSPGLPYWSTQVMGWITLVWEVGFPFWIFLPMTRVPALLLGVGFHLFTFFHLELAAFPLYALCLYVPLAKWEQLSRSR